MNMPNDIIETGSSGLFSRSRDTKAASDVEDLKFQIERLLITTEALWNILKEKHGVTEEELVRQMVMIDMRDGKLDGRVAKEPPTTCPKCGRTLAKSHTRCIYCGEPVPPRPFAR